MGVQVFLAWVALYFCRSLAGVGWGDSLVHSHTLASCTLHLPGISVLTDPCSEVGEPRARDPGIQSQTAHQILPPSLLGFLQPLLSQFMNLQSRDKNSTYWKLAGNKFWLSGARQAGSTL